MGLDPAHRRRSTRATARPTASPATTPAFATPPTFANWAPEVYAIGLRNVWKFSFDRENGTLWAGDVGQNLWEEIDIIVNGGNYGWSAREGFHGFPKRQTPPVTPRDLIDADRRIPPHPRPGRNRTDHGLSVTGGYVYRGQAFPGLQGVYVYADYETGRIWGLRVDDQGKLLDNRQILDLQKNPALKIASFGEDAQGEVYILAFDGKIYRLVGQQ